jgi:peptidoglycan/LPS O-acetylase OafA/YrhL
MSQGEMIAAIAGAALIILLFLPWVGDFNGWEFNTTTDVYLLITGLVAIAGAFNIGPSWPGMTAGGAAALLGAVATILLVWLLVFDFPEGADRGIGLILSVLAAAAVAYGGYISAGR